MPVRLTERDHAIFRLIDEHGLLLEKHLSYFLWSDQKPSFVRDRLRRLQYFDYVVCSTHDGKLSWWNSPTQPLMYALSPMTRDLIGASDYELDLRHFEVQRHLLEVANLRMIFYKDEKDGTISNLQWTTCRPHSNRLCALDAKVSLVYQDKLHNIGVLNQSSTELDCLVSRLSAAVGDDAVEMVCVISADQERQNVLEKKITDKLGDMSWLRDCVALAPHKQLYKSGVVKTRWQGIGMRDASLFIEGSEDAGVRRLPTEH